jgi:uncharacterized protein YggE
MKHIPILVCLLFAGVSTARAQTPERPAEPVVVTTGQATVTVAPDRAFVIVAAQSSSRNSLDAQRQNAEAMNLVLQKIQQAGVPKEAIKTIGYDLQPEFDYANGRQTFRGYVALSPVEVRLDEVDRVGVVIDAAAGGGATSIGGIRFDVRNRESVEREALRLAVADARARADAMAAGAGRVIDRVVRIEENGPTDFPVPMMRMAAQAADQAPTPIAPSTVEIRARVSLTASLR